MNKICTSLEQSKKLLELGIDPQTADMIYYWFGSFELNDEWHELHLGTNRVNDKDIPAWSLAALLEIMPYVDNIRPFNLTKMWEGGENNREHVKYVCTYYYIHSTESDNPIDACVEMIVYLKEKGLI